MTNMCFVISSMWVLGTQTQVLILVEETLHPSSHLSSPCSCLDLQLLRKCASMLVLLWVKFQGIFAPSETYSQR